MILTCRADADKWQRITAKDIKSSKAMGSARKVAHFGSCPSMAR